MERPTNNYPELLIRSSPAFEICITFSPHLPPRPTQRSRLRRRPRRRPVVFGAGPGIFSTWIAVTSGRVTCISISEGDKPMDSALKYYIYVSGSKVEMLYA